MQAGKSKIRDKNALFPKNPAHKTSLQAATQAGEFQGYASSSMLRQ